MYGRAGAYDGRVLAAIPLIAASYLLGTAPTAALVGRRSGHDVTSEGSGNPGASNTFRVAGARAGATVLALDLAKGAIAALVGLVVGGRALALACGVAAVVGHSFPVTRGLRGGRGVATGAGLAIVLWPLTAAALAVAWAVVARAAGKAALASLVVAVGLPAGVALIGRPGWEVAAAAALAVFIVARHAGNIVRLVRGEERSLRSTGR